MYTFNEYLKNIKREKIIVTLFQICITFSFLLLWEILSSHSIINPFLFSSPSRIINTIILLIKNNNLFNNIFITILELLISFSLSFIIGLTISTLFWMYPRIEKIFDPFINILNSLPKVALGPLIIIWTGANIKSIIFMSLLISTFIVIINIYNAFTNVDNYLLLLMKSFKASKKDIYFKLIIPANINNIISVLKVNISMNLIGVIMGELLVSKKGLGYLIMYGSQIFNLDLVIASVILLAFLSFIMYRVIVYIEKKIVNY